MNFTPVLIAARSPTHVSRKRNMSHDAFRNRSLLDRPISGFNTRHQRDSNKQYKMFKKKSAHEME